MPVLRNYPNYVLQVPDRNCHDISTAVNLQRNLNRVNSNRHKNCSLNHPADFFSFSCRLLITENRIRSQVTSCRICGGQSASQRNPGFLCHLSFHHMLIHLSRGNWKTNSLLTAILQEYRLTTT